MPCWASDELETLHHTLNVVLDPEQHRIEVIDEIRLGSAIQADTGGGYRLLLHGGLAPEVVTEGWRLERVEGPPTADFFGLNATTETLVDAVPLQGWRLVPPEAQAGAVTLRYGGEIHHELATSGEEYQRSFSETPGIIDTRGVFLSGTTFWVPAFGDELVSFSLEVSGLTTAWDVVSQGRRLRHEDSEDGTRTTRWRLEHPTEEIYLVAGPWHEYSDSAGEVEILAFLRHQDPGLAQKYLEATKRYLKLYQGMLTPYPYASFALVENFWETGYGMPGFTLLGPRIIRFPWILTSSYPHELLHNWWGNSVYVDYGRGNWCEGLTAYMADHLFAEQRGEGAVYRRATLKKYSDFVTSGNDFPLVDFSSRRSAASEAVGYGKSLMLYHMLRRAVGDDLFARSMTRFYSDNRFRRASFSDIAAAFEAEAGGDWSSFVAEWTERSGAPQLEIVDVELREPAAGGQQWAVRLRLEQAQEGDPFPITVPVAVTMEGREEPLWFEAGTCHRSCQLEIQCPARPVRLDVDPFFDVMRRLDPLEVPPALSTLFGAKDPLFVLPTQAGPDELEAWRELAAAWARPGEPRTILDAELDTLPAETTWVLGGRNKLSDAIVARLEEHPLEFGMDTIRVADQEFGRADHSLVLVARSPGDASAAIAWVAADPVAAIPGLARKLPHYTRYSYLGFRGDEPENVAKGMWQPVSSPLVRKLVDGDLAELRAPQRSALAELPPVYDADALVRTVSVLADPDLEGRGLGSRGLERATEWVEARLGELGLETAGDAGFRQSWSWVGGEPVREMALSNLVARIPGTDPALADRPVLGMAHLDHLGLGWPDVRSGNQGKVHPGADDNASGVAVLMELAATMVSEPRRPRPVLFAILTAEEVGRLGSKRLLEQLAPETVPFACVNLDTVGRLDDGKIFVLNAGSAREWRFIFMGVGYTTGAPISVVDEPLDSSDQMSCIERGVPAVQLFTGPNENYHRPSDSADLIDAGGMVTVTEAAHETVGYLAERSEPLTVTIGAQSQSSAPGQQGGRRASLGTMPDFSFDGPGVRIQQVTPGSAAEIAGIRAGDVVTALGGEVVSDLRSYSSALKAHAPGAEVNITLLREGVEMTLTAILGER
jgi:GNAT superfamily N-acetyltransferase